MLKQAVFLVGGLGTRLGDITRMTPKPLIETAGKPFLEYILAEAARHHYSDIVLLAGYHGEQFTQRYNGLSFSGARIRVICESDQNGTGGAVVSALAELDDIFLLANGDSFFDINLRALAVPPTGGISMALRQPVPGARYGTVRLENGKVTAFHQPTENVAGFINGGIYLVNKNAFDRTQKPPFSLELAILPRLAAEGRVIGEVFEGRFIDMGVPDGLERARDHIAAWVTRPAVFFYREGILNEDARHVHHPEDMRWLPRAREAIRLCNDEGYFVFVVANQAAVARGLYPESAAESLHARMTAELAVFGAHVDAFACSHYAESSKKGDGKMRTRGKLAPNMFLELMELWPINRAASFLIGDKDSDTASAQAAGIRAHLHRGADVLQFVKARLARD